MTCVKEYKCNAFSEHSNSNGCFDMPPSSAGFPLLDSQSLPSIYNIKDHFVMMRSDSSMLLDSDSIFNYAAAGYSTKTVSKIGLHKICMNRALKGFFGWIALVLSLLPVSLSRAKTDESLVATAKTFFSKPCRLQLTNCSEIISEHSSLSICCWYKVVGPSMSTTETWLQKAPVDWLLYTDITKIWWQTRPKTERKDRTTKDVIVRRSSHILDQIQLLDVLSYGLHSDKLQHH